MSLIKSSSLIGGLTLVSRIFGFIRDMLLARVLGAGLAADAYQLAFRLPNTFRRLFAEGAFSVAFVPQFTKKLAGEGGDTAAEQFANQVLSVFLWVLIGFSALAMLIMPWIVYALANDFAEVPGKYELSVFLSRLTFPYLAFISLATLFTGILNSKSRFGPGAFAPVLFNLVLIGGILTGAYLRGDSQDDRIVTYAMATAVALSGLVQAIYLYGVVRSMGFPLRLQRPRLTEDVRQLGRTILPATFGAGVYQVSQFVDTFFATSLPQGSLTLLSMADRLNQMPLGIVGIALGTAILPMIARSIGSGDEAGAQRVQAQAVDLAMLLCLPAAVALGVCAHAFVTAFFVGGRFTAENGAITASVIMALVAGLPAYVLVKVLTPGFFARGDTATPVKTALVALVSNIIIIIPLINAYGIVGLAAAGAIAAWINTVLLYILLHRRGQFSIDGALMKKIALQAIAAVIMGVVLWWLTTQLSWAFSDSGFNRAWSLSVLCAVGGACYFGVAYLIGGVDRDEINLLLRRRRAAPAESKD
jgi:putative peptidoglycan lipid II flippase